MPTFKLASIDSAQSEPISENPSSILWSPQQEAVFSAVADLTDSLQVEAVAGSGKTTVLVGAAKLMSGKRTAFCAFNKKIADEIKARTSGLPHVTAGTLHSFGLRSWKATAPDCQIDGNKLSDLADQINIPFPLQAFVKFLTEACKNNAWKHPVDFAQLRTAADHFDAWDKLPESFLSGDADPDEALEFVNILLRASIDCAHDTIDFSDMLYMPLCYGQVVPEFDWVLLDEAQDTNYTRRSLVASLLLPGARVCAVGDRHQSIFGFSGADNDAMDLIASEFQCKYLPLTVTYRCPRKIVEHAHQWVSHIEAAPKAPEGVLRDLDAIAFSKLESSQFLPTDVILCRNTRPLVSQALSMIRRGIGARVEGRDIGRSLQSLADRWKSVKSLTVLIDKLEDYRFRESAKFRKRVQPGKAAQLDDKVDSLIAVIESVGTKASLYDLRSRISSLFGDTEPGQAPRVTTLSTIHKAKGCEWDRVYLLGREQLQPSKWAKQEWEMQQERNLVYVAVTRAKRELVEVEYVG